MKKVYRFIVSEIENIQNVFEGIDDIENTTSACWEDFRDISTSGYLDAMKKIREMMEKEFLEQILKEDGE